MKLIRTNCTYILYILNRIFSVYRRDMAATYHGVNTRYKASSDISLRLV